MIIPINKPLIRNIAIYLRLSKDDGDTEESESISNQRAIILDYINKNFEYENYYEYVDDGVSGATFNRPGFKKMLKELKSNEIDLVITKNLARFARNYIEAGAYIEKQFPDNNIRYIAILDGIDNFEDRVENEFAPIKGVFNELFCKETSKSVKKSKRRKMKEGIYSCNVAPFGYKKDPENKGKLIIDEKASKIVKRIFLLKLDGKTGKEIADILNKEKIPTPAEYLKIKGLENRTKNVWTRSIISRIVNNEVYIGRCVRGKTQSISYKSKKRINVKRNDRIKTENTHEAIISEDIFYKIHNNNIFGSTLEESNPINTKFANLMYCGKCGEKMLKRKSRKFLNIHCPYRDETDYLCTNNRSYVYEELEKLIIKKIQESFDNYFRKNNLSPSLLKKYNDMKIEQIDIKLKGLNKDLGMLRFKIGKLYNERLQDSISEEFYKTKYKELTENRNNLNSLINELEEEKISLNNDKANIDKIKKVKKILKNINKDVLTEEDISELIKKIEVYENCIHIYYNFKNMETDIIPV